MTPRRVLLIHGICSSGATRWEIAQGLRDADVAAPDLRGHGTAPRAERYRAADYASDLGRGWDVVVGHSLGGLIAVRAAVDDPGFARRLVLLDPVLALDDHEAVTVEILAERAETAADIAAANPRWHPEHARLKALAARQADPGAIVATMRDNAPWAHVHLLDALTIPALVFAGPMHAPCSGNVEYRSVPGTGHSLHRDRPDVVLGSI